jgi:hypothetical protein
MALFITDEDARDLELQREIERAREISLHVAGDERPIAKSRYPKLRTFAGSLKSQLPKCEYCRSSHRPE